MIKISNCEYIIIIESGIITLNSLNKTYHQEISCIIIWDIKYDNLDFSFSNSSSIDMTVFLLNNESNIEQIHKTSSFLLDRLIDKQLKIDSNRNNSNNNNNIKNDSVFLLNVPTIHQRSLSR